jgi:anti-sigma factor RsiW
MRYLGGHLGATVSALLDGQLDPASTERAWAHVHACALCDRQVKHEGWTKTQLASINEESGPPPGLLGSLYGLGASHDSAGPRARAEEARGWELLRQIEQQGRGRRRTGLALAGAGPVAVLGLAGLAGGTLGLGGGPSGAPTTAITGPRPGSATTAPTAVIAPLAKVHGRVTLPSGAGGSSERDQGGAADGLQR